MNKRVKMGPVLVIGALVILVGVGIMLAPAPPPPPDNPEKQPGIKKSTSRRPQLDVPKMRKALASSDLQVQSAALQEIESGFLTTNRPGQVQILPALQQLALTGQHETLRVGAVSILRGSPDVDSDFFTKVARNDPNPMVKRAAILAMGKFAGDPDVERTLNSFRNDLDPGVRSDAVVAWVGYLMASSKAGDSQLASLLGQYENDISAKAALGLVQHEARVLPIVTNILYTSKDGPQRHGAAMVIALVCAGFSPSIENFARAAQVTHRQEAGHRSANPAGLKPLTWALKNDSWAPTREVAAQGLGYLGDARAAKPLAAALKDPDKLVRRRAAAALITVPAESVIPELSATATADADAEVRRFAVEALGWIGKPQAVPALVQATKDQSSAVRRHAAIQLGKLADATAGSLTDTGALDALAAMLGGTPDPDPDVRWAAVVALGKLRDPRAQTVLIAALSDVSPQVQNSAERALQRLGIARREDAGFRG